MWEVILEIVKFFKDWFNSRKNKEQAIIGLEKVVAIYDNMHRLINSTGVQRILIHRAHNGGGQIRTGVDLYLTCVYEDYTFPFISAKADFVKIPLDQGSLRMLVDCYQNGMARAIPTKMKEGFQKRVYDKEGVEYAELHFLYQDKNFFYFLSIATADKANIGFPSDRSEIEIVTNNIKKLLKP